MDPLIHFRSQYFTGRDVTLALYICDQADHTDSWSKM